MIKLSNYYHPTPKKWRKIGDSLLACAGLITGGGLLAFEKLSEIFSKKELKYIILGALIVGILGKFITNMVKSDDSTTETPKQ